MEVEIYVLCIIKINEETTITTELTDENVFTHCPECGKEIAIDLYEIFFDGGDLFGTSVYCSKECHQANQSKQKNNAYRRQPVDIERKQTNHIPL